VKEVTYFHVELEKHDVVWAEGLPTETYLDTGDRACFANGGDVMTLHPAWRRPGPEVTLVMDALGYAPLRLTGRDIDRVRAILAAQSARRRRKKAA
jgi:hypothetical protein